jgi:hypothetical protein
MKDVVVDGWMESVSEHQVKFGSFRPPSSGTRTTQSHRKVGLGLSDSSAQNAEQLSRRVGGKTCSANFDLC